MEPFFTRLLPAMILRSLHDFVQQRGVLHFDVDGARWTLAFGAEDPIREGLHGAPDLTLTFTGDAFEAFVDGRLDVGPAVAAGSIAAAGDLSLLESFARLLRPPSEALWP